MHPISKLLYNIYKYCLKLKSIISKLFDRISNRKLISINIIFNEWIKHAK